MKSSGEGILSGSVLPVGILMLVDVGEGWAELRRFITSLSKHLAMMGVRAKGAVLMLLCLGTDMMVVVLKQDGTVALAKDMLKMFAKISASWWAHSLSTLP